MDRFAELTGRRYRALRLRRRPRRRARHRADGLGRRRGRGGGRSADRARRAGRPAEGAALPPVRRRRARRRAAADASTRSPCSTGRKEPARSASRSTRTSSRALQRDTDRLPARVIGGRYGLASKEFTPAMAAAVFAELARRARRSGTSRSASSTTSPDSSLDVDAAFRHRAATTSARVFYGLGSDGTVGANKNSVKIIGEQTDLFAQGYFVYDSKKSGSMTVSHLRFGPRPIRSTYLIGAGQLRRCHQFGLLERIDVLGVAEHGATFLLNSPYGPDEVWDAPAGRGAGADHRQAAALLRRRREPRRARGRAAGPRQHGPADLLLRARRTCCPRDAGDRARSRTRSRRRTGSAATRSCSANFAAVDLALDCASTRSTCPRAATPHATGRCADEAPAFVQRVTRC